MGDARAIYSESALRSLPRLLSLLDRNPLSPTYGCFHRDYWLYKTSDFPDAVRQFGVHALALVYAHDFPKNIYRANENIRNWAIAGVQFWAGIQHADGSFDEFYPYERGWVGPTAFTTYTSAESLRILCGEMRPEQIQRVEKALRRAANFIAHGEAEKDHLANHHAMAFLAVSTVADILADENLRTAATKLWNRFLAYQNSEGWCLEYDGADPGYLSATVSFLAKVYQVQPTPELRKVLADAVEFCSYFVYPDGSYAGVLGSRNTLHFYPHGFEILSAELPMAASVADRMARGLADGQLVPPHSMSDRYVHYRVPEFLLAARDARPRPSPLPLLPYQRTDQRTYFPRAGIAVARHGTAYTVANLAKGGVLASFNTTTGTRLRTDTGWLGELANGQLVTSQWVSTENVQRVEGTTWSVRGNLRAVPSTKLLTLEKNILFRLALAVLGRFPPAAHWLKGNIRRTLILRSRPIACTYERRIACMEHALEITDELTPTGPLTFRRLLLGGDMAIRYVPQSRFFQQYELQTTTRMMSDQEIAQLNAGSPLRIVSKISA